MRIAILTGGGDCPGLNAAIRAIVKKGIKVYQDRIFGYHNGWAGPINDDIGEIALSDVSGLLPRGGTILGTSRTNPFKIDNGLNIIKGNMEKHEIDVLVAIGGEDTLGVAAKLAREGVKIIGIPKTIDNDLTGTVYTFGFDTAVSIITEAIDRLHTTAESHQRVMVLEVMGRHAGWLAVTGGIAGGADLILVPEEEFNIDDVCQSLKNRHEKGKTFSIVVVAEGARSRDKDGLVTIDKSRDAFGHVKLGGIGHELGKRIEERTGFETRVTVLGHVQRGGTPTAFDRVLATRYGIGAIDGAHNNQLGKMVSLRGNRITYVSLNTVTRGLKTIDSELLDIAKVFFE